MQLLHCENLSFSYDGKVAVKDVTFSISSGEYICIVGENGSGKSTLVKGLLQLHPPSGGTLRLGDCLKGGIGYLPQQKTSWKHFPASVLEVTLSGCLNRMKLRPFYGKKEKQLSLQKNRSAARMSCCFRGTGFRSCFFLILLPAFPPLLFLSDD